MKIVFSEEFLVSDYAKDGASEQGRIEVIIKSLEEEPGYQFVKPAFIDESDILLGHSAKYLSQVKEDAKLFRMASLSAGAAIMASEIAMAHEPAFACIRPPGHHASFDSSWGYCVFGNMGLALLRLQARGLISSAFVLDFDAHTGDGTINLLQNFSNCRILNPYREKREDYLKEIEDFTRDLTSADIIGVCAGFDTYIKDVGRKLTTFDFYQIGYMMKKTAQRLANGRRFAILEGGYYLPDLGKNVLAFCQGFQ